MAGGVGKVGNVGYIQLLTAEESHHMEGGKIAIRQFLPLSRFA